MRLFDPLPADHPIVRDGMICPVCNSQFVAGDVVGLMARGPVPLYPASVEAVPVHGSCAQEIA